MKYPLSDALEVAHEIIEAIEPACERIEIAGSIRRKKPEVGDIEILYIPKYDTRSDHLDLFGAPFPVNLADEAISHLHKYGIVIPRLNAVGVKTWGEKIKLATHVPTGIPVDLFATTADSWHNYLVCRTGSASNNTQIASAALARGWKWEPYSPGFARNGTTRAVKSEREVFDFVGIPYAEPWERN